MTTIIGPCRAPRPRQGTSLGSRLISEKLLSSCDGAAFVAKAGSVRAQCEATPAPVAHSSADPAPAWNGRRDKP